MKSSTIWNYADNTVRMQWLFNGKHEKSSNEGLMKENYDGWKFEVTERWVNNVVLNLIVDAY